MADPRDQAARYPAPAGIEIGLPAPTGAKARASGPPAEEAGRRYGYHLVLVPPPGDPPPEIRLRRLLKIALRVCRLRAVSVTRESGGSEQTRPDAPHEPCTPPGDVIGEGPACAFCCAKLARRYRPSQRFCSTACRMRFHGRLRPAGEGCPNRIPRSLSRLAERSQKEPGFPRENWPAVGLQPTTEGWG